MKPLFELLPTFRSVEGSRWASQDDAILCSILHLIGGRFDEESSLDSQAGELFERIREYNLLDHTFQQMVRLGYLEAPQLPAPAETVTIEEERPVIYDLMDICGGKADGWLNLLDGTGEKATDVRRMVLLDYQHNSHDMEGIDKLSRVLKHIADSIKPVVAEPVADAPHRAHSHYGTDGNARTLYGMWEQRCRRGGDSMPPYVQMLTKYEATFGRVPEAYDAMTVQDKNWFYQVYGS